ncbi:MAG: hypothetical protein O4803_01340, partial [Trichodesmium sp. St15_bin1_1]|nr:hypothetical protein [Trichodesmium sp. St15_bin1_1]MDE5123993.1 hypothetical protein [Trichodesmium sp. St19_bin1]
QNSYLERSLNHKNGQTIFTKFRPTCAYSAFQIDELHRHNQNLVGTLDARSLLWSTDMKNAVKHLAPVLRVL